jgi:hypothetical protein
MCDTSGTLQGISIIEHLSTKKNENRESELVKKYVGGKFG